MDDAHGESTRVTVGHGDSLARLEELVAIAVVGIDGSGLVEVEAGSGVAVAEEKVEVGESQGFATVVKKRDGVLGQRDVELGGWLGPLDLLVQRRQRERPDQRDERDDDGGEQHRAEYLRLRRVVADHR
ncbi:hypothetical protein VB779_03295 [Haloarculaceae archaeon H-GB11]|nr:hypothetical protein [Haloarculaceae archaeon H-GB11]